jgi:hypothetical protein
MPANVASDEAVIPRGDQSPIGVDVFGMPPHLDILSDDFEPNDAQIDFDTYRKFARPMLAALGLDIHKVLEFNIHCEGSDLPYLEIRVALPRGAGQAAAHLLQQFRLVPIGESTLPDLDESVSLNSGVRTTHRSAGSQVPDRT